jgi:hypothetical protein
MKETKRLWIVLIILLVTLVWGCSNGGGNEGPTLPGKDGPEGGGFQGDQPEPPIPTPYADVVGRYIIDMQWEADGDLVIATDAGQLLFTPYGLFKRNLGVPDIQAIANNDTGRGMSYHLNTNGCPVDGVDDDLYVSGGHHTVKFGAAWLDGNADLISDFCEPNITLGWDCPVADLPTGYEYHPHTGRTYILMNSGATYIGDGEEPCYNAGLWVEGLGHEISPAELCGVDFAQVILSYDQLAPFFDGFYNGPGDSDIPDGDWSVYVQKPVWDCLGQISGYGLGYQMMMNATKVISWNGVNPDLDPMNPCQVFSRQGLTVDNIRDFTFDDAGRMIMPIPNADSYVISEPVTDGQHILINRIVGGRQNGMGTGPGEFQGPHGVTINPLTQEHVICDTGNDRIQIFDQNGNYLRQFATGTNSRPRVALYDYWGNLLVAGSAESGLQIFDSQGSLPVYGSIEGFVKDKVTGLPLENAVVYIVSTFELPVSGAYTDEKGYFRLYTVPAGTHNMIATKPAYFDTASVIEVSAGLRTEVTFYIDRVPVTAPGTGNVTGTVMSQTRSLPMSGLVAGVEGSAVSDITNADGEFLLIGVKSGPQKLQLSRNGNIVWEKNIQVPDGQTLDAGFIYLPF